MSSWQWFYSNGASNMMAGHYFLTACTHPPDNSIHYRKHTMLQIHLCALNRGHKMESVNKKSPQLFKCVYDSSCTWISVKMWSLHKDGGETTNSSRRLCFHLKFLDTAQLTSSWQLTNHHYHWPRKTKELKLLWSFTMLWRAVVQQPLGSAKDFFYVDFLERTYL